jgi:hypothetical protein
MGFLRLSENRFIATDKIALVQVYPSTDTAAEYVAITLAGCEKIIYSDNPADLQVILDFFHKN